MNIDDDSAKVNRILLHDSQQNKEGDKLNTKTYLDNKVTKANMAVRNALKEHGMPQWKLATMIGISEVTLIRWLRQELPEDYQKELIEMIEKEGE